MEGEETRVPKEKGETSPPKSPRRPKQPEDVNRNTEGGEPETADDTPSVVLQYAPNCTFSLSADGVVSIEWDNGHAIDATRGAAVDYIPSHMHWHSDKNSRSYSMAADYTAMVAAKVPELLALAVTAIRQTAMGLEGLKLSLAEMTHGQYGTSAIRLSDAAAATFKANGPALAGLIQQTFTIMGLNALSLIQRGHHYNDADPFWDRLTEAGDLESCITNLKLGASNWRGVLFHDALHPIDIDWLASQVGREDSPLIGHVNGVLLKRFDTLPASTTVLGLVKPLVDEVSVINPDFAKQFLPAVDLAERAMVRVRNQPLDYCIHFQRKGVHERIKAFQTFEPLCAFLTGYLKAAGLKNATILAARSLQNLAKRNGHYYTLGLKTLAAFPAVDPSAEMVKLAIFTMLDAIQAALHGGRDEGRPRQPPEEH